MNYRTAILHSGSDRDPYTGASSIPIYQNSTFEQPDPDHPGKYDYSRSGNPTREALENTIAHLEGGACGFAFSSGMAATSSVLMLLKTGDHVVATEDIYGGSYRVMTTLLKRWGLDVTFVDMTDLEAVRKAIQPRTTALVAETPSNPTLKITDLAAVAALAREHNLLSIVDNTFMTPYLQRPLELGFDIVVHSATKFLGGHSDVIAGLAVTKDKTTGHSLKAIQNGFGAILGPQDSWLILRGIKTLAVRMDAQQKTAEQLANRLLTKPGIRKIFYPALPEHPGRSVQLRQAGGGGAVISFELKSPAAAKRFLGAVKLPLVAVSLGGVESILSFPCKMSHASMPPDERARRGITDALVRLSVGLEHVDDLEADIEQALKIAGE